MTQTDVQSGYAPVNGLKMYYEIHGSGGVPVVLLHGAYMSTGAMQGLLSDLAKSRQVIAADLQGHGRTANVDRPLQYEQMADDVAALMEHLGISQADIVGYSMGGGVGLQLAIRHPERVRKLVAMSAGYRLDGMYPEVIAGIAEITPEIFYGTPWYKENYAAVAPRPEDFPVLVEKSSGSTRKSSTGRRRSRRSPRQRSSSLATPTSSVRSTWWSCSACSAGGCRAI